MTPQQKFYTKKLKPLVGCMVTKVIVDECNDEGFFGLLFKDHQGKPVKLWILRDDEGNGPGSFEIER